MKKLNKIKLNSAQEMSSSEMRSIVGGTGAGPAPGSCCVHMQYQFEYAQHEPEEPWGWGPVSGSLFVEEHCYGDFNEARTAIPGLVIWAKQAKEQDGRLYRGHSIECIPW